MKSAEQWCFSIGKNDEELFDNGVLATEESRKWGMVVIQQWR
jgi:hypothetical protein